MSFFKLKLMSIRKTAIKKLRDEKDDQFFTPTIELIRFKISTSNGVKNLSTLIFKKKVF